MSSAARKKRMTRLQHADHLRRDAGLDLHQPGAGLAWPRTAGPRTGCRPGARDPAARPRWRRSRPWSSTRPACSRTLPRISPAPASAGQHPQMRHGEDDQPARVHAGVARRVRVGAHGPHLEADRAAVEQPPGERHGDRGEQHAQVAVATDHHRQRRGRRSASVRPNVTSWPAERHADHVADQLDRDVVEHDGGHHLVGAGECLEEAGDESVGEPAQHPGQDRAGIAISR